MFIKFDNSYMLDFFEKKPISIGEEDAAIFMYSIEDSRRFAMTLTVDTYAKQIKKSNDVLLVDMEGQKRLVIKKYACILENKQ